jgi:hypothetical protein
MAQTAPIFTTGNAPPAKAARLGSNRSGESRPAEAIGNAVMIAKIARRDRGHHHRGR